MRRYVYFPAGRRLWLDLAQRLATERIATPVIWLGDKTLEPSARQAFPDCDVLDMAAVYFGDLSAAPIYTGAQGAFFQSPHYFRAKERAGKMLDRLDRYGTLRSVSRDVYVNAVAMWALEAVSRSRADALVMAESPHAAVSYLFYEVCDYLGLDIYSFMSWSFVPGVGLREGISGPMQPAPPVARLPAADAHADALMEDFVARVQSPPAEAAEGPGYMERQRKRDRKWRIPAAVVSSLRTRAAPPGKFEGVFAADGLTRASYGNKHAIRVERTDKIISAMRAQTSETLPERYVYFPLHYEPERTTNPDGGDFHDQLKTIAVLRGHLPPEIGICVKEHPSQLMISNKGFMGRSPAFYAAARAIAGVVIVSPDLSSRALLDGSVAVATITGTAALEAAILGKPGILFGTPWFKGCPNTVAYDPGFCFDAMMSSDRQSAEEVLAWLKATYRKVGMFGTVNPSNERLHRSVYQDPAHARIELDALAGALAAVLGRADA